MHSLCHIATLCEYPPYYTFNAAVLLRCLGCRQTTRLLEWVSHTLLHVKTPCSAHDWSVCVTCMGLQQHQAPTAHTPRCRKCVHSQWPHIH